MRKRISAMTPEEIDAELKAGLLRRSRRASTAAKIVFYPIIFITGFVIMYLITH